VSDEKGNTEATSSHDAPSTDPEEVAREIARAEAAAKTRRLAALKAAGVQKGEVRNPKGHNGRQLMAAMRRAMDKDGRRDQLAEVAVSKAIVDKDLAWARFVADYDDGKPAQSVDLTSSDGSMSPVAADAVGARLRAEIEAKTTDAEAESDGDAPPG
jgi:hypothetical protein